MRLRHDRDNRDLHIKVLRQLLPIPTHWFIYLTPLAVLTGFALSFGSRMPLTSCGTALIMSTRRGTTVEPCFFAT
jgi:hypothetical protein